MKPNLLNNHVVIPDDELVFRIIGDNRILWQQLFGYLHDNFPGITYVWKYYNDGKCWLLRALNKKKTVFWLSLIDDTFRVTCYMGDKAHPLVEQSDLPQKLKNEFFNAQKYGAIRGLTVTMHDKSDVENVIQLIGIKLKLK